MMKSIAKFIDEWFLYIYLGLVFIFYLSWFLCFGFMHMMLLFILVPITMPLLLYIGNYYSIKYYSYNSLLILLTLISFISFVFVTLFYPDAYDNLQTIGDSFMLFGLITANGKVFAQPWLLLSKIAEIALPLFYINSLVQIVLIIYYKIQSKKHNIQ